MDPLLIPIAGIALPLVLVPIILVFRHVGRRREWEHAERMKAMELGLLAPGHEAWPARACIAIGAGVPLGSFALAWLATQTGSSEEVWGAATGVGVTALICGTILARRLFHGRPATADRPDEAPVKAEFDPDAYDVVGRRG